MEFEIKRSKKYNPNTFNIIDAVIILLVFFIIIYSLSFFSIDIAKFIIKLTGNNGYYFINSILMFILDTLIFLSAILYAKIRNVNVINGGGMLSRKQSTEFLMCALLALGMLLVFQFLATAFSETMTVLEPFFKLKVESSSDIQIDAQSTSDILVYLFIASALFPAVSEEVVFRGVVMRGFSEYGKLPAVILSAVAFAFAHGSLYQLVYQFIAGLVLGFVALETKNIICGMVLHFCNNAFSGLYSLLSAYLTKGDNPEIVIFRYYFFEAYLIIFGIICLTVATIYFGKRMLNSYKLLLQDKGFGDENVHYEIRDLSVLQEESKPWYEPITLSNKDSKKMIVYNSREFKVNKKSPFVLALSFTFFVIAVEISLVALDFIGLI